jgi:hypothetical protein
MGAATARLQAANGPSCRAGWISEKLRGPRPSSQKVPPAFQVIEILKILDPKRPSFQDTPQMLGKTPLCLAVTGGAT